MDESALDRDAALAGQPHGVTAAQRRGFRNIGIVVGDDLELAERRFFDSWIRKSSAGAPAASSGAPALAALRMPQAPDVLGLFPAPGTPP